MHSICLKYVDFLWSLAAFWMNLHIDFGLDWSLMHKHTYLTIKKEKRCNLTVFCWIIFLPQSQFWYKARVFLGLFCRLEDTENGHLGNRIPDSYFPWHIPQWVGAFQSLLSFATSLDNMKVNGCLTQVLVFWYRIHWFSGKEVTGIWEPSTWIHVPNIISWNINALVRWYITHMWWNSWIHCKYIRFKFMGNQSKSCLWKLFLPHFVIPWTHSNHFGKF